MLRSLKDLENCAIGATDGNVGQVKEFCFDDHDWVVRYLIVDTGPWPFGRKVLISPISIAHANWAERTTRFRSRAPRSTRERYRGEKTSTANAPVSSRPAVSTTTCTCAAAGRWSDSASTSATENSGCREPARRRRDLGGALPGRQHQQLVARPQVLIAPPWISGVRWLDDSVTIHMSRDVIRRAPVFESTAEPNRKHETPLYRHHGLPGYWTDARLPEAEMGA